MRMYRSQESTESDQDANLFQKVAFFDFNDVIVDCSNLKLFNTLDALVNFGYLQKELITEELVSQIMAVIFQALKQKSELELIFEILNKNTDLIDLTKLVVSEELYQQYKNYKKNLNEKGTYNDEATLNQNVITKIKALRNQGWLIYIVSNDSSNNVRAILESNPDLSRMFDGIWTARNYCDSGDYCNEAKNPISKALAPIVEKPSPYMFLNAAGNTPPSESLMVGDSWSKDMVGYVNYLISIGVITNDFVGYSLKTRILRSEKAQYIQYSQSQKNSDHRSMLPDEFANYNFGASQ